MNSRALIGGTDNCGKGQLGYIEELFAFGRGLPILVVSNERYTSIHK